MRSDLNMLFELNFTKLKILSGLSRQSIYMIKSKTFAHFISCKGKALTNLLFHVSFAFDIFCSNIHVLSCIYKFHFTFQLFLVQKCPYHFFLFCSYKIIFVPIFSFLMFYFPICYLLTFCQFCCSFFLHFLAHG